MIRRRDAVARILTGAAALGGGASLLGGCAGRRSPGDTVLYSSVDDYLLRDVVGAFRDAGGGPVLVVGDTEATKTVGLAQRLLAERDRPRADVWWSGEPFFTLRLAEQGVFEAYDSPSLHGAGWPAELIGPGSLWTGLARRARVIAFDTRRVGPGEAPTTLGELVRSGRTLGMARPDAGTTAGHMALLLDRWGADAFGAWLVAARDAGLRQYPGNSGVVRGLASGEIALGLTDSDDVLVAQDQGWPVGMVFETPDTLAPWPSTGAMPIPSTLARVRGGPNPVGAAAFIDYLLSPEGEARIAASASRNVPARPSLRGQFPGPWPDRPATVDYPRVASRLDEARELCRSVLGA